VYAGTIVAEQWWAHRMVRAQRRDVGVGATADVGVGETPQRRIAGFDTRDTLTSLAMGALSLAAPLVVPKVLAPITPGVGRHATKLVGVAAALAVTASVADRLAHIDAVGDGPVRGTGGSVGNRLRRRLNRRRVASAARRTASAAGVGAVMSGGLVAATAWSHWTSPERLWARRVLPDLGTGPVAFGVAMVGWDFIYYWNHRLMHEVRALWAIHVVHHSSERYNLSTALRQPVADALGMFVPTGLLSLLGVRPSVIAQARAWNLLYQYWVHTEAIDRLGPAEEVLNTPSLHRVHHGSNRRYLDRNHGGILIIWDRLFGTHVTEDPDEPVVYGLTKNIHSFNPAVVASHEHVSMLADVAHARNWRHRLGHLVRRPGWQPAA
jgi:sterol desaturase/sphingolipid hydroxylase (fatty acid hydroxylase superfamily)